MTMFDKLADIVIKEQESYVLNDEGKRLVAKYRHIITQLEQGVIPLLRPLVQDVEKLKKEIAVQIVSTINSLQMGNEEFDLMSKLDTFTNGGTTPINTAQMGFHPDDNLLNFLEKTV